MTSPATPVETVLHAEQLQYATTAVPYRRVRLSKRVVWEEVTVTVTVGREVVEVVEEDVPVGSAPAGSVDPTAREWTEVVRVTAYEEVPVVTLHQVPVETVRLLRRTVVDQQAVQAVLAREELTAD